jgi:hypothetical protein
MDKTFDEVDQRDWRQRRFILILFKRLYQSPFKRHQNARFFLFMASNYTLIVVLACLSRS